ncbi:MAG: helix-turn-helix domain-containing protein, partial [Candidatus Hinthialibacter sp.]
ANEQTINADAVQSLLSIGAPLKPSPVSSNQDARQNPTVALDDIEKMHIKSVLQQTGYNISLTAELLKIDRRTLQRKMVKYQLREN